MLISLLCRLRTRHVTYDTAHDSEPLMRVLVRIQWHQTGDGNERWKNPRSWSRRNVSTERSYSCHEGSQTVWLRLKPEYRKTDPAKTAHRLGSCCRCGSWTFVGIDTTLTTSTKTHYRRFTYIIFLINQKENHDTSAQLLNFTSLSLPIIMSCYGGKNLYSLFLFSDGYCCRR